MSTLKVASIQSLANNTVPLIKNVSGVEKGTFVNAWLNMNGTGTISIRDSFNVSSITDLGTGYYRINFSLTFANNDYCFASMLRTNGAGFGPIDAEDLSTTNIEVRSYSGSGLTDRNILGGAVFGTIA